MFYRILMLFAMIFAGGVRADGVVPADDLRAAGAEGDTPVVVFFSATYCAYCTAVKSEFFRHLESDPRYASRIVVREVIIDSESVAGEAREFMAFARDNEVSLVPTVRFFDGDGRQLARQMVGVTNMDFYGWYLDQRIRRSIERLNGDTGGQSG